MKTASITQQNAKTNNMDFVENAAAASDTEFTGAVYTGLLDHEQIENINEILPFEPGKKNKPGNS